VPLEEIFQFERAEVASGSTVRLTFCANLWDLQVSTFQNNN